MMAEEWRPVVGFPGYEVSSYGRVRSLDRLSSGKHPHGVRGRMLAQHVKPGTGYLSVGLTLNGHTRTRNVHVLVAAAFIGPRPAAMDVRHDNGVRTDNSASNLRYGTRGDNLRDSVRHGTHTWASKTSCKRDHPYDDENTRWCWFQGGWHRRCRECERMLRAERKQRECIETRELRAA